MDEGNRLLSGYRAIKLCPGFESRPLRHPSPLSLRRRQGASGGELPVTELQCHLRPGGSDAEVLQLRRRRLLKGANFCAACGRSLRPLAIARMMEDARRALDANPNDLSARYNLALAYKLSGLDDLAVQELDRVAERQPDFADVHYELAQLYLKAGRREEAAAGSAASPGLGARAPGREEAASRDRSLAFRVALRMGIAGRTRLPQEGAGGESCPTIYGLRGGLQQGA